MFIRTCLLIASLFTLAACKTIKVEHGEVPDEYRAMAQAYMGTYAGAMNGERGSLSMSFQGRKVVLKYLDASGGAGDILDARCDSKIGDLESVQVSKDGVDSAGAAKYKLDSATFAFDANRCWGSVEAREVTLDFSKKKTRTVVDASLLIREDMQRNCRIDPGNPRSGVPPREICDQISQPIYQTGRFSK